MLAIITNKYRLYCMHQFQEALTEPANSYLYLFISRSAPWPSENAPPDVFDSTYSVNLARESMMAIKKIVGSDTIPCVPRRAWTSGVVYDEYRHNYSSTNLAYSGATSLYPANFYVITDDNNVYKCISNNYDTPSTSKPTGTSTSIFGTADGYWWKYMYTISPGNLSKFNITSYIPVEANAGVIAAAVDGAIHTIRITNGGSGYLTAPDVTITGDGINATATAQITGGIVTGITMTNVGSGYRHATVTFSGGNATAEAIISPTGGHGLDVQFELGATSLLVNVKIEYDESGKFITENDYRTIGIIEDPLLTGGSTRASATAYNAMDIMDFASSTGDFLPDEIITVSSTGAIGRVVEWDNVTDQIKFMQTEDDNYIPFEAADVVYGQKSGANGTIGSMIASDIQRYSGEVLYLENRTAISRSIDQIDSITFVLKF